MPAAPKKRIRRDPDTARARILATAERLMTDEGYAAVTSRRVAREAGLTSALVHYYYATLFIALHRRLSDQQVAELKSLWKQTIV